MRKERQSLYLALSLPSFQLGKWRVASNCDDEQLFFQVQTYPGKILESLKFKLLLELMQFKAANRTVGRDLAFGSPA